MTDPEGFEGLGVVEGFGFLGGFTGFRVRFTASRGFLGAFFRASQAFRRISRH